MKSAIAFFLLLALSTMSGVTNAQNLGGRKLLLDDGLGHTITIQAPSPSATYTWTLSSSSAPSNMPGGTLDNSTLRWNAGTGAWLENTNILATSAVAITATSLNLASGAISTVSDITLCNS